MYNHLFLLILSNLLIQSQVFLRKIHQVHFLNRRLRNLILYMLNLPISFFPDFGSEPMHEDLPVPKCGHVEYDPELFNLEQFDYGSLDDHSPTQEPYDEHIPEVLTTSAIPSVIAQLRKKNTKIRKLKEVLRSYEQTQQEQYLLLVETETYNEQWRAYSLKLLQKNEKLKGKSDRAVVGIKRL